MAPGSAPWRGRWGAVICSRTDPITRPSSGPRSPVGDCFTTAGKPGSVRVWTAADHSVGLLLAGHRNAVRCVALPPDGERIATGGWDETVRLWDARKEAEAPQAADRVARRRWKR